MGYKTDDIQQVLDANQKIASRLVNSLVDLCAYLGVGLPPEGAQNPEAAKMMACGWLPSTEKALEDQYATLASAAQIVQALSESIGPPTEVRSSPLAGSEPQKR